MQNPLRRPMESTLVSALFAAILALVPGCPKSESTPASTAPAGPGPSGTAPGPRVVIKTSMGDIVVELNPSRAPITVKNFLRYVREKHYDGTIFHRVKPDFMIQGGGYTKTFVKKTTHEPIKNEAPNGLSHVRGTIAMARTSVVHSSKAQFFINVTDNDFLNHKSQDPKEYGYAVFGKVVSGMDVVDKIKDVKTGKGGPFEKDCPLEPVEIISIREK